MERGQEGGQHGGRQNNLEEARGRDSHGSGGVAASTDPYVDDEDPLEYTELPVSEVGTEDGSASFNVMPPPTPASETSVELQVDVQEFVEGTYLRAMQAARPANADEFQDATRLQTLPDQPAERDATMDINLGMPSLNQVHSDADSIALAVAARRMDTNATTAVTASSPPSGSWIKDETGRWVPASARRVEEAANRDVAAGPLMARDSTGASSRTWHTGQGMNGQEDDEMVEFQRRWARSTQQEARIGDLTQEERDFLIALWMQEEDLLQNELVRESVRRARRLEALRVVLPNRSPQQRPPLGNDNVRLSPINHRQHERLLARERVAGRSVGEGGGGDVGEGSADGKPAFVGVTRIRDLPVFKINEAQKCALDADDNGQCIVCLVEYEIGDEVRLLPCMHRFHNECISPWLARSPYCPMCKLSVRTGTFQGEARPASAAQERRHYSRRLLAGAVREPDLVVRAERRASRPESAANHNASAVTRPASAGIVAESWSAAADSGLGVDGVGGAVSGGGAVRVRRRAARSETLPRSEGSVTGAAPASEQRSASMSTAARLRFGLARLFRASRTSDS